MAPELPDGTITFLFTDIEGSTRLLERLGRESYGRLLDEHRELLRAAVAAAGGVEVDAQGDAFFVAFSSARAALDAALTAQRALATHEWPQGSTVRVRMGLHTGEAELAGERYVGVAVHRAQRIAAAAHGGQVLLSETTRDVIADDLPAGVGLRDLGVRRFKDVGSLHVHQVVIEGLPSTFPAPRTLDRPRRRRAVLAGAGVLGVAGAVIGVVVAVGGSSSPKPVHVAANSIAVVDPRTNRVVRDIPVGQFPSVTVGGGFVWAMNGSSGTVSQIDPKDYRVTQTRAVGKVVTGIAADAAGAWVSEPYQGTVSFLDPAYGVTTTATVSRGAATGAPGPVALGFGSVWVGVDTPANELVRVRPSTGSVIARIPGVAIGDLRPGDFEQSGGVAVGSNAVWAVSHDADALLRIDPARNRVDTTIAIAGGPAAIAVDGKAVWVTVPTRDVVWLIDAVTRTAIQTVAVGRFPSGVASADGAVWVANDFGGTVTRIDPRSLRVTATIRIGHSPAAVAVGFGRVWVAVRGP